MDCSKLLTIFGLIFNTIAAVILIFPYLNIKKNLDGDFIVSMDKDGKHTQKKHLKERRVNIWGLTFLIIGFILQLISIVYVEKINTEITAKDNYDPATSYILSNGCDYGISNNAYTECVEKILVKIKTEKVSYFKKFENLMIENHGNVLITDEKMSKEFFNWYKSSDDFNRLRCLANIYWTGAGSAYNQNLATCQIFETQRDIQLLDELYTNKEYFKDWEKSN